MPTPHPAVSTKCPEVLSGRGYLRRQLLLWTRTGCSCRHAEQLALSSSRGGRLELLQQSLQDGDGLLGLPQGCLVLVLVLLGVAGLEVQLGCAPALSLHARLCVTCRVQDLGFLIVLVLGPSLIVQLSGPSALSLRAWLRAVRGLRAESPNAVLYAWASGLTIWQVTAAWLLA